MDFNRTESSDFMSLLIVYVTSDLDVFVYRSVWSSYELCNKTDMNLYSSLP